MTANAPTTVGDRVVERRSAVALARHYRDVEGLSIAPIAERLSRSPATGRMPSLYDWSRTHARRRGRQALERLDEGDWPAASVVTDVFGTWAAAGSGAARRGKARPCRVASRMPGQTIMEPSAASGLLADLSNRVQPPAGLRGRSGAWPVCMVNA
jgi:hypothetical protein